MTAVYSTLIATTVSISPKFIDTGVWEWNGYNYNGLKFISDTNHSHPYPLIAKGKVGVHKTSWGGVVNDNLMKFDGGYFLTPDLNGGDNWSKNDNSFSLQLWFKPFQYNCTLLSIDIEDYTANLLEIDNNGYLYAGLKTDLLSDPIKSDCRINLNNWNHLIFRYEDKSKTFSLILNNGTILTVSINYSFSVKSKIIFKLGGYSKDPLFDITEGGRNNFKGYIAKFRIVNSYTEENDYLNDYDKFYSKTFIPYNYGMGLISGSIRFNGDQDFISIPMASRFWTGTSDFTIEWWQYLNSNTADIYPCIFYIDNNDCSFCYLGAVWDRNNSIFTFKHMGQETSVLVNNFVDRWVHIAIVRKDNCLHIYKDGKHITKVNSLTDNFMSDGTKISDIKFTIGCKHSDIGAEPNSVFGGCLADFHFVNGIGKDCGAKYVEEFDPPTLPIEPIIDDNTSVTKLLLNYLTDCSWINNTIRSHGNVEIYGSSPYLVPGIWLDPSNNWVDMGTKNIKTTVYGNPLHDIKTHVSKFNGIDTYISLTDIKPSTAGFTIITIFDFQAKSKSNETLFDFGDGEEFGNITLFRDKSTNDLKWQIFDSYRNNLNSVTIADAADTGLKMFALTSSEGLDNLNVYLNNNLILKTTGSLTTDIIRDLNFIGKSNNRTNSLFSGHLGYFIFFDRVLTKNEIIAVYNKLSAFYIFS